MSKLLHLYMTCTDLALVSSDVFNCLKEQRGPSTIPTPD